MRRNQSRFHVSKTTRLAVCIKYCLKLILRYKFIPFHYIHKEEFNRSFAIGRDIEDSLSVVLCIVVASVKIKITSIQSIHSASDDLCLSGMGLHQQTEFKPSVGCPKQGSALHRGI
jgi:hypothetical protein